MRTVIFTLISSLLLLTSCTNTLTSTIPLSKDVIQITATAIPECGETGAQKVALRTAAIETIKHGYDKFIVDSMDYQDNVRATGRTPIVKSKDATGKITVSGGQLVYGGSHNQRLTVKMFKGNDPKGKDAVSARKTLGPKWKKIINSKSNSCFS